jgi:hypothetical protein
MVIPAGLAELVKKGTIFEDWRIAGHTGVDSPASEGTTDMALEKELSTYKAKIEELKPQAGRFVLIHGDAVIDTFGSYDDALKEGYAKFGLDPFLVKRIDATEQAHFISRFVVPAKLAS